MSNDEKFDLKNLTNWAIILIVVYENQSFFEGIVWDSSESIVLC